MTRKGLGRGLRALIPDEAGSPGEQAGEQHVTEISVDLVRSNPYQPRHEFDENKMQELIESIRQYGVVQPLLVRPSGEGYELIAGERRWRAARRAGLKTVPVVVRDVTDAEMLQIALIENLQRDDLTPMEQAEAYRRLVEEFGLTQEELAEVLGKSRPSVANTMRLLNLPAEVQSSVSRGTLSMGHARALLSLTTAEQQVEMARAIVARDLSVRQTEELVRRVLSQNVSRETQPSQEGQDRELRDMEDRLKHTFGTQVRIKAGQRRGKIEIEYYTRDDLERILSILLSEG